MWVITWVSHKVVELREVSGAPAWSRGSPNARGEGKNEECGGLVYRYHEIIKRQLFIDCIGSISYRLCYNSL